MYLADYPNWPSRHRQAVRYAKGRVLDVGCGAGRHALYLKAKGLDIGVSGFQCPKALRF